MVRFHSHSENILAIHHQSKHSVLEFGTVLRSSEGMHEEMTQSVSNPQTIIEPTVVRSSTIRIDLLSIYSNIVI